MRPSFVEPASQTKKLSMTKFQFDNEGVPIALSDPPNRGVPIDLPLQSKFLAEALSTGHLILS